MVLLRATPFVLLIAFVAGTAAERSAPFEVAASLYPWELHDEGVEPILDHLQRLAAVNSVYLVALMHPEPRPHRSERFPHNPVRERLMPEDAALYWHPAAPRYGRIPPFQSAQPWLRDTDWVARLASAARRRGLKVGAEISHSLIPEAYLRLPENADLVQRDLHGQPAGMHWAGYFPCLNHPDVQHYLAALFSDLASGRDLDFLQTCLLLFSGDDLPQAGCFCQACATRAQTEGIDFATLVASLKRDPQSSPHLQTWRDFRRRSAVDVYRRIHAAIKAANPKVEFRLNHHARLGDTWDDALLAAVIPDVDSIRISDYAEQEITQPDRMPRKEKWLQDTRAIAGPAKPILAAIGIRPQATPKSIGSGVTLALRLGVQGVSLGHYDGSVFSSLRAVRQTLAASRVAGATPILGHRLGEILDRSRRKSTPEAAGVAANNRRRLVRDETGVAAVDAYHASFAFEFPDGRYDVLLTCADLAGGRGRIALRVNDRPVGEILLDRDHGAWRILPLARDLALRRGDALRLTGTRDGDDWAIADFIEFVPTKNSP